MDFQDQESETPTNENIYANHHSFMEFINNQTKHQSNIQNDCSPTTRESTGNCSVNESTLLVIDTNILMEKTEELEILMDNEDFKDFNLFIPWRVYQELNSQKHIKSRWRKIKMATDFLTKWQLSSSQRIKNQSGIEEAKMKKTFPMESSDDWILQTCLHLQNEKHLNVKLWTLDKLMRLKANTFNINLFIKDEK